MDKDDSIRFRVENENFVDVGPMRFGASGAGITSMMTTEGSHESLTGEPSNSAPYTLTVKAKKKKKKRAEVGVGVVMEVMRTIFSYPLLCLILSAQ